MFSLRLVGSDTDLQWSFFELALITSNDLPRIYTAENAVFDDLREGREMIRNGVKRLLNNKNIEKSSNPAHWASPTMSRSANVNDIRIRLELSLCAIHRFGFGQYWRFPAGHDMNPILPFLRWDYWHVIPSIGVWKTTLLIAIERRMAYVIFVFVLLAFS